MKTNRYILSLLLLVVSAFNLLPANAQQNQYAIYNYRNDGDFNAWLNIDVDSITYSCIDTLGVEHDEVVVQEVWTPDSVYRIPINAIDSLAFRAPKPVMREGLFYLREYHASHTVDIDSLTLYFDMGIRNDSLPAIGQVVLNGTYNSPYEEGFAGKVLSIKKEQGKIIIVCENAEIYDIFKKLIIVGKSSNDLDSISNAQRIRRKSVKIEETDVIENIKVPDLEMSVLDGIFKVKSKAPKVTCGYFVYVDELIYSISADAYIRHNDLSFEVAFKYSQMADAISDIKEHLLGQIESDYSRSTLEKYLKEGATIPLKKGVINISLKLAPQIKIDGDLELDFVTKTSAKQHIGFKAKGYTAAVIARLHNPFFSLIPFSALGSITKWDYSYVQNPAKSTSLSAKATGSAKAGFLVQLEANLIHKNVVHASVGVEAGRKLSGTLQFNIRDSENPDMNFYDIIKDTNVDLKSYAKIKGGIGASPIDFWTLKGEIDLYDDVLGKYYIVPHFTKPELPVYQNNSWNNYHPMSFYSTISKDILFTCKPGMRIVDEQGNIIKEVNTTDEYKYEVEWRYRPLEMDISDLEANKTYRCYPTFCFWGSTYFKAGPYKEFTVPRPISFETDKVSLQIGKSHKVAILGGWGDYSLGHLNKTACNAELKKEGDKYYVQLFGKAKGMAPITVNDLRSGKSKTLIVDVTEEEVINLTLSENSVSLQKGDRATVTITSGSGNYTLANSDASVAVAAISNGNQIVIAALKAGTATITVTDTKTKQTTTIAVTVTDNTHPNKDGQIVMERKYKVHHGGNYHEPQIILDFGNKQVLHVGYLKMNWWGDYSHTKHGIHIIAGDDWAKANEENVWYIAPTIADEWVTEKLIVDLDGKVQYYMNGQYMGEKTFTGIDLSNAKMVSIQARPYGWWTGHSHYMDDFSLTTPFTSISDDFNDGVLDTNIWLTPVNPDGVREEDGILKMEMLRTDQDFDLRSKPIPLFEEEILELCPDNNHPHTIDLGLPSGALWACCNVGATKPEENGDYFAWGETEPKENYSWGTYKWCNGNQHSMNKYCYDSAYGIIDNKTVLELEDDAAYMIFGSEWRMPTKEEQDEFRENCDWEWTIHKGVMGMKVKSRKNDVCVFLPACGYRSGNSKSYVSEYGYYQSASLDMTNSDDSYYFYFNSAGHYWQDFSTIVGRDVGFSVRPVRMSNQNSGTGSGTGSGGDSDGFGTSGGRDRN